MNLPDWVRGFLEDKTCPHCSDKMSVGIIECLGIKMLQDGTAGLFFESKCPSCDKVSQTILQNDRGFKPIELAAEIYNSLDDSDDSYESYEYRVEDAGESSGISCFSDEDLEDVKNFLSNNDLYIDLLYFLGCSDGEIEKYAKIDLWEQDE